MPKAGAYAVRKLVQQEVQPTGAPCTPHSRWDPGKRCMGYPLWGPGCSLRQFLDVKQSMAFRGHSRKGNYFEIYLVVHHMFAKDRDWNHLKKTDVLINTGITLRSLGSDVRTNNMVRMPLYLR